MSALLLAAALLLPASDSLLVSTEWLAPHRADPDLVVRAGHIPGAVQLDWTELMSEGRFRDKGDLRQLLAAAGATPAREIITYCGAAGRAEAPVKWSVVSER